MRRFSIVGLTLLLSVPAYAVVITKGSKEASEPSKWKVGDVIDDVGTIKSIEAKGDGKYLIKAERDGYKFETVVSEARKR